MLEGQFGVVCGGVAAALNSICFLALDLRAVDDEVVGAKLVGYPLSALVVLPGTLTELALNSDEVTLLDTKPGLKLRPERYAKVDRLADALDREVHDIFPIRFPLLRVELDEASLRNVFGTSCHYLPFVEDVLVRPLWPRSARPLPCGCGETHRASPVLLFLSSAWATVVSGGQAGRNLLD